MTCPRCGQQVYPNVQQCPNCGLNFAPAPYPPAGPPSERSWQGYSPAPAAPDPSAYYQPAQPPGYGSPGQPVYGPPPSPGYGSPGMPAQSNDPYGAPPPGGAGFSAGSLITEDALPEWMRQGGGNGVPRPGMGAPAPAVQSASGAAPEVPWSAPLPQAQQPAYPRQPAGSQWLRGNPPRPDVSAQSTTYQPAPEPGYPTAQLGGPFPSIEQVGTPQAQRGGDGMAAQSLLDASAVPSWLTGQPQAPQSPPAYGAPMGDGMPASALIDEHALPQWLRAQPQTPAASAPASGMSQWMAPPAQEAPSPSWMGSPYPGTPASSLAPPPGPFGGYPQEPMAPAPGTLSAGQFVDDTALPGWLRAQSASAGASAPMAPLAGPTGRVPVPGPSAWGMPPSVQQSEWTAGPGAPLPVDDRSRAVGADEATAYLDAPAAAAQPGWMNADQMEAAPRSGELSERELPPWLRDGHAAAAAPNGRMPAEQWDDQQWDDQQWDNPQWGNQQWQVQQNWNDDPYAQPGYGQPQEDQQGEYDQYGQYGPYDQNGQYADYGPYGQDGYDPGTYDGFGSQGSRQPPREPPRGGLRGLFRRK
jgi:hypothetical protein